MAHELDMTTGQVGMAYVGDTPWHGLGQKLPKGAGLDVWRKAAGLDWSVLSSPVLYQDADKPTGEVSCFADQKVLYRDDTRDPLSVVSGGYNPVQPGEVLGFMEQLVSKQAGLHIETAGSIRGGRRIWALARVDGGRDIVKGDRVRPYYLIATSYDKSMATVIKRTKIRVVCNNTLSAAAGDFGRKGTTDEPEIKVYHFEKFDADKVSLRLEQAEAEFAAFVDVAKRLAEAPAGDEVVDAFLLNLFRVKRDEQAEVDKARKSKGFKRIAEMFATGSNNPGHDVAGQTLWGLINSVTRYVDFERGLTRDTALDSAWFGDGDKLKTRAFSIAEQLVTA